MGTLALDIETASPFEEPADGGDDTAYFEWLSVAVGYVADGRSDPETAVLFRRGGWVAEYTAALLDRLLDWTGVRPHALADLTDCLVHPVDVARAAADRHEETLWDDQVILPDWKAYELEGIDNETVWYDDYAFDDGYLTGLGVDHGSVKGAHLGRELGERYVDGVVAGIEDTRTFRELKRLLVD